MKLKTKITTDFLALLVLLFFYQPLAIAKGIDINCDQDACQPQTSENFFSTKDLKPGDTRLFYLNLKNTDGKSQNLVINFKPKTTNQVFKFKITDEDNFKLIYEGYLLQETSLNLGTLEPQKSKKLKIEVSTPADLDNSWQGASFEFDSNVYMELEEADSAGNQLTPTASTSPYEPVKPEIKSKPSESQPQTNLGLVLGQSSQDDILATQTAKTVKTNLKFDILIFGLVVVCLLLIFKRYIKLRRW